MFYQQVKGVIMANRIDIDIYEHMNHIHKELKKGVLLTTKHKDAVNSMTISWGHIGIEWARPIFIAYVRQSRHTLSMLASDEFTINIPMDDTAKKILGYCGTKSGCDTDKIKDLNLTLVDGVGVNVPAIKELPMTLECKIIYKQPQDLSVLTPEIMDKMYPVTDLQGTRDYHTMFYGEIVSAYIVE